MSVCASVENMMLIKNMTKPVAKQIRSIWKALDLPELLARTSEIVPEFKYHSGGVVYTIHDRRRPNGFFRALQVEAIDHLLKTEGFIELGRYRRTGERLGYFNQADSYALTVVAIGDRLIVCSIEALIELDQVDIYDPGDFRR